MTQSSAVTFKCTSAKQQSINIILLGDQHFRQVNTVTNQFEERVIRKVFERELALAGVTRVCLPEHSVSVPWHYLSGG